MLTPITSGSPTPVNAPRTADGPRSRVDAAYAKIAGIESAITGLQADLASIQQIIAELQAELALLSPPQPSDYKKTERRYDGSELRDVTVFDAAAFGAAMSAYLAQVNSLQSRIQQQQDQLAKKEDALAQKQQDLADAQAELAEAQAELESALANDAEALAEAQARYQEELDRIAKLQQEALEAEARAQKAQDDLAKSQAELQKLEQAALDLGGYDEVEAKELEEALENWDPASGDPPPYELEREPGLAEVEAYNQASAEAKDEASAALDDASRMLPRKNDAGAVLPPLTPLSTSDFVDVAADMASFETGLYAQNAGLLAGFDPENMSAVTPEMREEMIAAWTAAGFTAEQIRLGFEDLGLEPDPVLQARIDYEAIQNTDYYSEGGSAAQDFVDALAEHENDAAYQAAMIELAKNDTSGLNLLSSENMMTPGGDGIFSRYLHDGSYSGNYTDEQRAAFVSAMSAARDAGVYTDDELRALASDSDDLAAPAPFAWQELCTVMGVPGVEPSPLATLSAATEVEAAQGAMDAAATARSEAQQELEAQMENFGVMLTPEQREAYVTAYWADHQDIVDAYDAASESLAVSLAKNTALLEAAASADPPDRNAVDALYKGYKSLATTPHADAAADFVVRASSNQALSAAFDAEGKDIVTDILEPAATTIAAEIMANPAITPEQALNELEIFYQGLQDDFDLAMQGKEVFDKAKDFVDGIKDILSGIEDLQKLSAGTYTPELLADKITEWENKGAFGQILAVGTTLWAFKSVYTHARDGEQLEAIGALASALKGSSALLAKALGAYARAGTRMAKQAGMASAALHRFVPFLGAVASAITTVVDIKEAMKDGNAGDWAVVAGDLLTFAGACAACTGAGVPLGALLMGIGAVISIVGEIASSLIDKHETREAQEKYLKEAGFSDEMIAILLDADKEQLEGLAELGLTPEQIQGLAARCPPLVETHHGHGPYLPHFVSIVESTGLSGDAVYEMLIAAEQGAENPGEGIYSVAWFFSFNEQGGAIAWQLENMKNEGASQAEMQRYLKEQIEAWVVEMDGFNPDHQRALQQAADSLP